MIDILFDLSMWVGMNNKYIVSSLHVGGNEYILMINILFDLSMWAEKLEEARPRLLELDSMTYSKPVPASIHYDDVDDDF